MKVNVSQLRRTEGGSVKYQFSERFPPLQLGNEVYAFQSPVEVALDVTNTGKSLLVKGKVFSYLAVICSRCLNDFLFRMQFEFEDEWIPVEFSAEEQEGTVLVFEKDEFPIEERIAEHILLHLPMRFICSEACKGLCSKCGIDRNLNQCSCMDQDSDPRLEILSKWNKGV